MCGVAPSPQVGDAITAFLERQVERMLRSPGARPSVSQAPDASNRKPKLPLLRLKVRAHALGAWSLHWVEHSRARPEAVWWSRCCGSC